MMSSLPGLLNSDVKLTNGSVETSHRCLCCGVCVPDSEQSTMGSRSLAFNDHAHSSGPLLANGTRGTHHDNSSILLAQTMATEEGLQDPESQQHAHDDIP